MHRTMAIIEREMRRFSKSPMLIIMSMVFPLLQLVVLGYAFGGNVKHLTLAIVDEDHGLQAVRVRELASAVESGAHTVDLVTYADRGTAITDLRNGRVNGVLTIPPDFSRRVHSKNEPRVALASDNTDTFVSATLAAAVGSIVGGLNADLVTERLVVRAASLDHLEGVVGAGLLAASGLLAPASLTHWVESGSPLGHAAVLQRLSVEVA